jgi:hypothetical protein
MFLYRAARAWKEANAPASPGPVPARSRSATKIRGRAFRAEAAFPDLGLLANRIDGRPAAGPRPDQFPNGFHQSLFGITDAAHDFRFRFAFSSFLR